MNDDEFDLFVEECQTELEQKQNSLTKAYRLGQWDEYAYDTPTGGLQFKDKLGAVQVQADTWPIGSFSTRSNTWQWTWANKSTPAAVRQEAEKLQELYQLTNMDVFTMPTFEIDESMAWGLVAMCVSHLDAQGCYAMPAGPEGNLLVYVAIQAIRKTTG